MDLCLEPLLPFLSSSYRRCLHLIISVSLSLLHFLPPCMSFLVVMCTILLPHSRWTELLIQHVRVKETYWPEFGGWIYFRLVLWPLAIYLELWNSVPSFVKWYSNNTYLIGLFYRLNMSMTCETLKGSLLT